MVVCGCQLLCVFCGFIGAWLLDCSELFPDQCYGVMGSC